MAKTYRFFIRTENLRGLIGKSGELCIRETDEPEIFSQMIKVLRVREGDGIILLCGDGNENAYNVLTANKKEIRLFFIESAANKNEPHFNLTLALCMPNRPEKLDFIIQKAVELGVGRIILLEADFSRMKHKLRKDRLEKILIEAAEQSERAIVPNLQIAGKLSDFLDGYEDGDLFIAMERSESKPLHETVAAKDTTILIGPEGGFSDTEKSAIRASRAKTFSLGPRILRMETAAILSLGIASIALIKPTSA